MNDLIKDFIVGWVIESDYVALASLTAVDGSVLDSIYLALTSSLRVADSVSGRDSLDYIFTDAHRKTLIEPDKVFGTVQVLKGTTSFALPNDQKLVEHFLNSGEFNNSCTDELKSLAISASVYGQEELVRAMVDWMIVNLVKKELAEDIYKIYEVNIDPWIFRRMCETGLLSELLISALKGRIKVIQVLLDDIDALCDLENPDY